MTEAKAPQPTPKPDVPSGLPGPDTVTKPKFPPFIVAPQAPTTPQHPPEEQPDPSPIKIAPLVDEEAVGVKGGK